MESKTHLKLANVIFFFAFFALVLFVGYVVLEPYLSTLVLALLTVVMFRPVYNYFLGISKNNKSIASLASTFTVVLTIVIPFLIVMFFTFRQILAMNSDLQSYLASRDFSVASITQDINNFLASIPGLGLHLSENQVREGLLDATRTSGNYLITLLRVVGGSTFELSTRIVIYLFVLFGLFPYYEKLIEFIHKISPLDNEIDRLYINRVIAMSISMVKGTFLIGVIQGCVAGVLLWTLGVKYVAFWTLLMVFFSIIPLGNGFIMYPIGIVLILTGNVWQGITILVSQFLIITNIDNAIRPRLVSKQAQLHPVLVLLSVLGGIQIFGFFGFIYGPVIMIFVVTTFEVYLKYYNHIITMKKIE